MTVLVIVLGVLLFAVLIVLAVASSKPDEFRVERNVVINETPDKIFPWLEDPKKTAEWSPWEKKDPNLKKVFSGSDKGVGAVYEWDGNKEIGAGRLEIKEVVPLRKVVMDLKFFRPMKGENVAEYNVAPAAGGTEVKWSIRGSSPFMTKIFCVFMDMDKMIGGEFEKGLAELKSTVER
ncbi:MAG: SRPBCC family protein [Elusimicrobia bacterium]|nr:SRPBCC family protein [Elusimicrobiota bacterium]